MPRGKKSIGKSAAAPADAAAQGDQGKDDAKKADAAKGKGAAADKGERPAIGQRSIDALKLSDSQRDTLQKILDCDADVAEFNDTELRYIAIMIQAIGTPICLPLRSS